MLTHRSVPADPVYWFPLTLRLQEHPGPEVRQEDRGQSVEDGHSTEDGEEDVPQPQHQVDLLVDNVEWQNTHGIMVLPNNIQ